MDNVPSIIINFFSPCACIYFCDNFNNSLKNLVVLNVAYFVYCRILRPMCLGTLRVNDRDHKFEPCPYDWKQRNRQTFKEVE